jgi:hypothetical protein
MGLDFRKSLIAELERRRREIDEMVALLRRIQDGGYVRIESALVDDGIGDVRRRKSVKNSLSGGALYSEIFHLRQQGLSLRAIAEHVNLSHAGVWKVLRRTK